MEQSKYLKDRTEAYLHTNPEVKPLLDKLLSIDGEFVIIWMEEPDLEKILARGHLFEGQEVIFKHMIACQCHKNAGELWFNDKMKIVTGWALSEDRLWRQHSWALKGDTIIETTTKREKYFGVVLTEKESEIFYANNF